MSLNYNTIQALVNDKYLPILYNNIFSSNHYMLRNMKDKAKTYDERKIVVSLEYAKTTNVKFTKRFGTIPLSSPEIITAAEYTPAMLTGSLSIPLEDELENKSSLAIQNIIATKMANLEKSIEAYCATHIWARYNTLASMTDSEGNPMWNTLDFLVNNEAETVGGIATGTYDWWASNVIDLSSGFNDDATAEADLVDAGKDVFLKKLLQKGIARSKYLTGENPTVITVPQYIWDLLEFVLDPQKKGTKMNEKAASMGFNAIDYRNIPIIAEDDMVAAQTSDTDGRMYFFNEGYLYMFFNSGAKFKASEFTRLANQNAKTSLVNAYGNIVCSNRKAQTVIRGIRSPKTYVTG